MSHRRNFPFLYVLALFLTGIGYLAIMPVFEGFDEQAHYSSMRQIASTGTIPVLGKSFVDRIYEDYQGPRPYTFLDPPFDDGLVYSKFFNRPDLVGAYGQLYRQASSEKGFEPGNGLNWQAQHPPLYYLLMAPLAKAVGALPLVAQFFVLRLTSFLLALVGVVFGLLAAERSVTPEQINSGRLGFIFYPVFLPMFFPEFTRIGNDALCLFWVGAVAYLLSLWRKDERNIKLSLALGVTLGFGLLTKALFLPITVGLAAFLSLRLWRDKRGGVAKPCHRVSLLTIFYPALLIGGGWYLSRLALHGDFSGGIDSVILAQHGGLIAGLKEHFSLYALGRSAASTFFTFSWAGTQSLACLPLPFRLPLLALTLWVFGSYLNQLRGRHAADYESLPVWVFGFFGAALFYHLLMGLALDGKGHTPGWYLHILMPLVAPAVGAGVYPLLQKPRTKILVVGLLIYAFLFQIVALWSQFALFAGCATKGEDTYYAFPSPAYCLDRVSLLTDRLAVLGWPILAAVGFGGAIVCVLVLSWGAFVSRKISPSSLSNI